MTLDINELERIMLHCPGCGRKQRVKREDTDPIRAAVVQIRCERCNPGDFDTPHFFDADGQPVSWDEGMHK